MVVCSAGLGAGGLLARRYGGDHAGSRPLGQLHRIEAHRAGAAGDQHDPSLHRACGEQGHVGGHAGNAQGRALGEADRIGKYADQIGVQLDIFRRRAERAAVALAVVEPNPFADQAPVHPRPHRLDHAGAVAVGGDARIGHRRARPAAHAHVRRVDPRSVDADQHFAPAGCWFGAFAHHQHLAGGAGAVIPGGAHGGLSVRVYLSPNASSSPRWGRVGAVWPRSWGWKTGIGRMGPSATSIRRASERAPPTGTSDPGIKAG